MYPHKKNQFSFTTLLILSIIYSGCTVKTKRPQKPVTSIPQQSNQTTKSAEKDAKATTPAPAPISAEIEASNLKFKAQQLEKESKNIEALALWNEIYHLNPPPPGQLEVKKAIEQNILYHIKENELISLLQNPLYEDFYGWVYFRLGEFATESGDSSSALLHFESAAKKIKDPAWSQKALYYVQDIQSVRNVSPQTIGVVLPLSGKNAEVGRLALRGIQLGLGMHLGGNRIKLAIIDSEGNPDVARRGVDRLVREDQVIGIIGDIVSKSSVAAAAKADEYKVPILSLSQKSNITELGNTVFQASFPSELQAFFLVRTAMKELGMKKFAILYPNDSYGVEMSNNFWDAATSMGAEITAVQSYSPNEKDFRFPIQRLIGTFYAEARTDELQKKRAELSKAEPRNKGRRNETRNLLNPIIDFDAVFVPDGSKALGQVSAMFAYNDVRKMTFLGTNLWNTPDLVKRVQSQHEILFVDSLPLSLDSTPFAREFSNIYSSNPGLVETQAYDAGLIYRRALSSGASNRDEFVEFLQKSQTLPGSVGSIESTSFRVFVRPTWAFVLKQKQLMPLETSE
ncbi:MAG TPA: penicillin-binding protein activator [Pseudobdellovibrionaceae bacterium]|nr:penicillin-binding protein activator [Pseudobdellovibrionaceae bacterium]